MDNAHRDLILACEIAGLLHDLGKLHPGFALEKLKEGDRPKMEGVAIREAHGAILEVPGRAYPPADEDGWLLELKEHTGWGGVLCIPEDWLPEGRGRQARGLGAPLREHHGGNDFLPECTLLGTLYMFGADIRDSALDKGSGGTLDSKQALGSAYIADSFGRESKDSIYGLEPLKTLWARAGDVVKQTLLKVGAWADVSRARTVFLHDIEPVYRQALGETRRPTNDVTLWHHCFSSASLFKSAVAECVLRKDFTRLLDDDGLVEKKMGRVQFRLLGVRWDWAELTAAALQPVMYASMGQRRDAVVQAVRQRIELQFPVGNVIYHDDDGVVAVVPGFYETDDPQGEISERLFQASVIEPLIPGFLGDLADLGAGASVRLVWTEPRLYLTDYAEALGARPDARRQRLLQVGEGELRGMWQKAAAWGISAGICPQCGLRPARVSELALYESGLRRDKDYTTRGVCDYCAGLAGLEERHRRKKRAKDLFAFQPATFNLAELRRKRNRACPDNTRLVLLSVVVDPEVITTGKALLTQLARPPHKLEDGNAREMTFAQRGDLLQAALVSLRSGSLPQTKDHVLLRTLVGDGFWMKENDWRFEATDRVERARRVAEEFFLREQVPGQFGLFRHDGDRLALFGMRKHASPARVARLWDDLETLWQEIVSSIATQATDEKSQEQYAAPISLDSRGFRIVVAAEDARAALRCIKAKVEAALGKVRSTFGVHLSAVVFREKFPFYIAIDALRRLESRAACLPMQAWELAGWSELGHRRARLDWRTPQGNVNWEVDGASGDQQQPDLWYPHLVREGQQGTVGELVHVDALCRGARILVSPSTFDFIVLDTAGRRFDIRYDADGRRPHPLFGDPEAGAAGRPAVLLEHLDSVLDLLPDGIPRWNASVRKAVMGQIMDAYLRWVGGVPRNAWEDRLRARQIWIDHCNTILRRHSPRDHETRAQMMEMLEDGRLFDAFEWAEFVEKGVYLNVAQKNTVR